MGLLKLAVERLPVDADAGIADEPFFGVGFGKRNLSIGKGHGAETAI